MIDHGYGAMLGPVDRAHKERMRQWRNDPRIYAWCRQDGLISDQDQDRWFERQSVDPSIRMFMVLAILPSKDVEPCGVAGLTSIDWLNRRAEFSLYVAPGMHRKGLGEKALLTLLSYGFRDLGLHVIWGETFESNPAIKLFKKIGFTQEGTRRGFYWKHGRHIDAHLISMTEDEWRQRYSSQPLRSPGR